MNPYGWVIIALLPRGNFTLLWKMVLFLTDDFAILSIRVRSVFHVG